MWELIGAALGAATAILCVLFSTTPYFTEFAEPGGSLLAGAFIVGSAVWGSFVGGKLGQYSKGK